MKLFTACLAALLAGYLMGGLSPSAKLSKALKDIDGLQMRIAEQARPESRAISGVNQLLDLGAVDKSIGMVRMEQPVATDGEPDREEEPGDDVTAGEAAVATNDTLHSLSNQLELAASAWGLRSDLAKQSFMEKAALDERQTARLHVLLEAMNIRLEEAIHGWTDAIREETLPSEEAGIRMIRDLSNILVLTYDEMDRNMPEDWREKTDGDFSLTSFIDPTVALPLAEVEKQLQE